LVRMELFREEGEWLPGVLDVLLKHDTHCGREGICDECKWRGWIGVRQ
jgi:hypothetical protein